jgi:DNA mismatch endonuclease (patch repair protein)
MSDVLTPAQRRLNMQRIRSKGMKPEMRVRRLLHGLGYRYRLHVKTLPGKPDLVFPSRRKIVFVHGCFWHQHEGCKDSHIPLSRCDYWEPKLSRNAARDAEHTIALRELGYQVLAVWECQTRDVTALRAQLEDFLGPPSRKT